MAKTRKPTKPQPRIAGGAGAGAKPGNGADDGAPPAAAWFVFHFVAAILFGTAIVLGLRYARAYVERDVVYTPDPPTVALTNRPPWMGDFLAEEIIRTVRPVGAHSAFDRQMLIDTVSLLNANPWIRDVKQVRRVYGQQPGDTLQIDCDYRAPIALVKWGIYYWLVDGDGYKLPEQYTADLLDRIILGADGHTNIRIISGVHHAPVETGRKWPGDDLAAGIAMVKLLYGHDYAEAIRAVDVSNYKGRVDPREAQLVLLTKDNTEVRWGRAPGDDDYFIEVSVDQKLQRLKAAYDQYGRVDAGQKWIDIRFDKPTTPAPETASIKEDAAK
jgi:hypothetical protein